MRKYLLPLLALVFGAVGAMLRQKQLQTGFEAGTGLAVKGNLWALLLIGLCALAAIVFILLARGIKLAEPMGGAETGMVGPVYQAVCCAASLALFVAGLLGLYTYFKLDADMLKNCVLSIFAIVAAGCTAVFSLALGKGNDMRKSGVIAVLPVFFMCLWLIIAYRAQAANPVIYDYVYEMFAIICGTLGFFYSAGFVFGKVKPARAVFFMLMCVVFSVTIISETPTTVDFLFYVFLCVYMLARAIAVIGNSDPQGKRFARNI